MRRVGCGLLLLTIGLVAPLPAEVSFAEGRLAVDGLLWTRADIGQSVVSGWTRTWVNFKCLAVLLGLTGTISDAASVRLNFDVWNRTPLDLYARFAWPNGFSVQAGQFKLPLGIDIMLEERELKLGERTFLQWFGKPAGPRDIGALFSYSPTCPVVSAQFGMVNGTGPNTWDNNNYKDLCGRVEVRPLQGLRVAGNGYYGRTDSAGVRWVTLGGEVAYQRSQFLSQTEFRYLNHGTSQVCAGYLLLAYDFGLLEPAGHIDAAFPKEEQPDVVLTIGLNIKPLDDRLKVILAYHFHKAVARWTYYEYGVQLQTVL